MALKWKVMRKMDKKIFEKKMRNKYRITAVSLLVVTLFFGTAMTSAIAGSVDKSQSSSTSIKATGCPLCASQGNSEGQNSVAAQLPGGGGPSAECDLVAMAQVAIIITSGLWNILRNIDLQEVKALIKQGFDITKAIGLVVSNFIQKHSEELTTLLALAMYASVLFLQTEFVQKASAAFVTFILAALPVILAELLKIRIKLKNLLRDDGFQQLMVDIGKKILVKIADWLLKICKLCNPDLNPDLPQGPTVYTEPTSVPSTQQSSVSSASSSQSSSVISQPIQPIVAPISQPIVASSKQQSIAVPIPIIGVTSTLMGQQTTNN